MQPHAQGPPMFGVDRRLLDEVRARLASGPDLHWIVGGSCAGKSTVSLALAARSGVPVYDMDAHMYGVYRDRYVPARHPACSAWFRRGDGLRWSLSLPWWEFDALNRAVDVEILDLLSRDLVDAYGPAPMWVDGGISHPSVLAAVLDPKRVVCLTVDEDESRRVWETDDARAAMRTAVEALSLDASVLDAPAGDASAWGRFLAFNRSMSETMLREAHDSGIAVVHRRPGHSTSDLADAVTRALGP